MRHGHVDLSDAFAIAMKKHRLAKSFSRETLSEKAGVHQTYIGLIERGLRNPSVQQMRLRRRWGFRFQN